MLLGTAVIGVVPARAQEPEEPPPVLLLPPAAAEQALRDWQSDVDIRVLNTAPPQVDPAVVVVAEQSLANPGWSIEQMPPVVDLSLGVTMPVLDGLSWAEARSMLEGLGLTPSPILSGADDTLLVTFAPTGGLPVVFGAEVSVKLVAPVTAPPEPAPTLVTVPQVDGARVEEAEALLREAGLGMALVVVGDQGEVGTIVSQDPGAGTAVEPGTGVTGTAQRVPSEPPATSEATAAAAGQPPVGPTGRDGGGPDLLVPGLIVLAGVALILAAGAIYRARGRAPRRVGPDWVASHVRAVPSPDRSPVLASQADPGKPSHAARLVAERGPAPTFREETAKP